MTKKKTNPQPIAEFTPSPYRNYAEYKEAKQEANREPLSEEAKSYLKKVMADPDPEPEMNFSLNKLCWIAVRRGEFIIKKPFILDDDNRRLIRLLCMYFSGNPEFESAGDYSLKKGIMLRGNVGLGKTVMLKIFADGVWQDRCRFDSGYSLAKIISCKQVEREFLKDGFKAIEAFTKVSYKLHTGYNGKVFVFDDLGAENTTAKSFGNAVNVMEEVFSDRYELFCDSGIKTHCTTNLMDGDELEKHYGSRIRSRIREMFNVIDVVGNDRRK